MAHSNFRQLRRLISMLDYEDNDIFVHIDLSAADFDPAFFEGCCRNSYLEFIGDRVKVNWGGYSIIKAEIKLIGAALARGGYDYLHLLSGFDLPIKSQEYIHAFFLDNNGLEFVESHVPAAHTLLRYRYYTLFPESSARPSAQLANNIVKFILKLLGRSMNRGVDFRCGSQWFSITSGMASWMYDRREWIDEVFSHTNTSDEAVVPTLLAMSPYAGNCSGYNMRFIDWERRESGHRHPHTFTENDIDELRSSRCLFARKFNETVDSRIIERIEDVW